MRIVLVHGWGFDASLWDEIAALLPDHEIARAEFGFFAAPPYAPSIDADTLCVGHSLGVLWLLVRGGGTMRGLMSINGFDRFGGQAAALRAMRAGLKRDGARQIGAFRAASGMDSGLCGQPDEARLAEGLDWLAGWDGRAARKALTCPLRAMASRDDRIAPQCLMNDWGDAVVWSDDGGHVLPLTRAGWCARHILDFANDLDAQ